MTRPVSRSTTPCFDWARPESWPAALDAVSKAYVTYQPDLAVPGAADAIENAACLVRATLFLRRGRGLGV